jgi:hypothetical protein
MANHQLSQTEIAGDSPCSRQLSGCGRKRSLPVIVNISFSGCVLILAGRAALIDDVC